MNLDIAIFVISAAVAVFGATMMIAQRNPVASVLYMIVSLIAQAVLYIQLGAMFLGAVLIIVYAGAILVLFLFIIMLLNLRGNEDLGKKSSPVSQATKFLVSILFVIELVFVVRSGFVVDRVVGETAVAGFGSVEEVAMLLFTRYLYPFELASVLLLAAIVGAVVMARRERRDDQPTTVGEGTE
ncbi:MAG: NADH-quinone oxidoreductase subunit J [candidate division Zixibacteria bacterium]|nr:NADH-quinone oxidoreductase subunit J [candidate division Zixibacteria bacterium]